MQGKVIHLAIKTCVECGEDFEFPSGLEKGYATCSAECTSARRQRPQQQYTCQECGKVFNPKYRRAVNMGAKFCGNDCRMAALQRSPRPFKDRGEGWLDDQGHVILKIWEGDEPRIIKRARLVVESMMGRRLTRTEVVHHINLSPADDRPENLWLCRNQAEHMRIHAFTQHLLRTGLLNLVGNSGLSPSIDDDLPNVGIV
jgi:hypothetical protein